MSSTACLACASLCASQARSTTFVVGPVLIEERIAPDRDFRIDLGDLTELHANVALACIRAHGFREHANAAPPWGMRFIAGAPHSSRRRSLIVARGDGQKKHGAQFSGRGGGRALLNVRNFSGAILRGFHDFPGLLLVVPKNRGTWPGCSHRHRLLLTIFERGLRGLGLYQWVSTAAFKKIEKAARPSKKSRRPRHFLKRPRL